MFAHTRAEGAELRLDATEVRVRPPLAGRGGRRAFVSGEKKQNSMKATVIADHQGRTLWPDALRPGRMHEATATRSEGIGICSGTSRMWKYCWTAEVRPSAATTPARRSHRPENRTRSPPSPVQVGREEARRPHSSKRVTVEHAPARELLLPGVSPVRPAGGVGAGGGQPGALRHERPGW
ncbi:transposase family protein [Streptomyces sp. NPDC058757]|uniref:transposase family protein n=1 Tax=Streptomyces sp. NPDC058757 TaxID=3346626 RepID=UPI0036A83E2C